MKILLVEDEVKLTKALKQGLANHGFTVDIATNGLDGLDMAADGNYEVIVLDWMLPGMDGVEFCHHLRQEEKINTPIIMLTAKNGLEDKVLALETGVDDYLAKPFAFRELLARIRALSRRKDKIITTKLKTDSLEVDLGKMTTQRYKVSINLSRKEFDLLVFLLKHKGRIVSKSQIINSLWPYDTDVLENNVEAYIKFLRKKIEQPFKNKVKLIETLRGFGYRIKNV